MEDIKTLVRSDQRQLQTLAANIDEYMAILEEVRTSVQTRSKSGYTNDEIQKAADAIRDYYLDYYGVKLGNLPDDFYKANPDGNLLAYAYKYLHGDDLVSFAEGAMMIYGCSRAEYSTNGQYRTYMNTRIRPKSGIQAQLNLYWDPEDTVYPKRVSRQEIKQMLGKASRAK